MLTHRCTSCGKRRWLVVSIDGGGDLCLRCLRRLQKEGKRP